MGLLAKAFKMFSNIFSPKKTPENRDPVQPTPAAHVNHEAEVASTTSSVRVSAVTTEMPTVADVTPKHATDATEVLDEHSKEEPTPVVAAIEPSESLEAPVHVELVEPHELIEPIKAAAVTGEIDDLSSTTTPPAGEVIAQTEPDDEGALLSSNGASFTFTPDPEGSHGVFRVFNKDDVCLFEQALSANLYNAQVSPSGRLAALQTTVGSGEDSNRLMLVDVDNRRVVFSVAPETRWADAYEFDDGTQQLKVILDTVGAFEYDAQGKCLDQYYFDDPGLNIARYSEIIPAAQALLDEPTVSQGRAKIALQMAIKARSLGADKDARWNPLALKVQGLAYDQLGQSEEALDCMLRATELKPRLGLKRKIDALTIRLKATS